MGSEIKVEFIINKLQEEVKLATGCTEPVAVALAAANAYRLTGGEIKQIKVIVSANILKNAKSVGIPGAERTGVEMAVLIGVSIMRPRLDLTIFSSLGKDDIGKALSLEKKIDLQVEIGYSIPPVYIEVEVRTDSGSGKAIIADNHDNLVYLEKDNTILLDKRSSSVAERSKNNKNRDFLKNYSLRDILLTSFEIEPETVSFLLDGIKVNMKMAEAGLKLNRGLKIGSMWNNLNQKGILESGLSMDIAKYTAAACDARMAGVDLPVMSSAGSGNQGLLAVIPLALVADEFETSQERLIQALVISHLVTVYIKEYTGRLSPVCGCSVAAGAGSGAGITYLLGGNLKIIETVIKNIIASLAGMVCDGGKVGCSLKLCTSAVTAWWNAVLALEGLTVPANNGILAGGLQQTIINLQKLSSEGMENVDRVIVSMLEAGPLIS